ncbi:hypothetical protein N7517_009963 [Penicillium concentricum]|uniref:Uncharacterized protein n=1 Tax=Penicillium concentricum TaxID=293559 RepID=A0A9W9RI86_9EURO|nr:uncharacterized protein N7517_009963 [Penicillium concentricum]KAJ5360772.1 hypothetical protein N7517_009963 [Penicillium concentricum]
MCNQQAATLIRHPFWKAVIGNPGEIHDIGTFQGYLHSWSDWTLFEAHLTWAILSNRAKSHI